MHSNKLKVALYSLGCKVNAYDTEAMREMFLSNGFEVVDFKERADIYIVNTCTVTHLGDRKSRQILRRAKRKNPDALVIATGCYAQVNPEDLREIPEVDLVIGTKGQTKIVERVLEAKGQVEDYAKDEEYSSLSIEESGEHTRAYVKIQDGCNQFCSYCIVPYARGPVRSRSFDDALREINRLAQNGYREIILTGIHIASYGKDRKEPDALIELIEEIGRVPGIERIRLSSLEPGLITKSFVERLAEVESFCPHFHLSLQSGSESVLKRMHRRYTPSEYLEKVRIIRDTFPDAGITTDIIVGFPGETEEEFAETLAFVEEVGFSRIHIFPYSPRAGTPAAKMEPVEDRVKKERVARLTELEEKLRHGYYKTHDKRSEEVLFERQLDSGAYSGYTRNYIPVQTVSDENLTNQIREVELNFLEADYMEGTL